MSAFGFKAMFEPKILDRSKGGTIRAPRKDRRPHAKVGGELQLYVGMRTRSCRLISRETCVAYDPIVIHFGREFVEVSGLTIRRSLLDTFAVFDGFDDFASMAAFWAKTHPLLPVFHGSHIRWLPWPNDILEGA